MNDNDRKALTTLILAVATVLISLAVTIGSYNAHWEYRRSVERIEERKTALENGYVERTLPGVAGVHWVKPESESP